MHVQYIKYIQKMQRNADKWTELEVFIIVMTNMHNDEQLMKQKNPFIMSNHLKLT